MIDHPSRDELMALLRGGLPLDRAGAVMRHLLEGCESCRAAVPSFLAAFLGIERTEADPISKEEDSARDAAMSRVFLVARKHARHLRGQRDQAHKALLELEAGGLEVLDKVSRKTKGLALYEALLARSWALRHEDPRLMIQYAWLATRAAEKLDRRRYGEERLADFRCRAWAELANALRVADQLVQADSALARAAALYHQGTGDELLGIRLLELQASLAADRRYFGLARKSLSLVYRFYYRQGDFHLAGRALISKGLYTGYAGEPEEALKILRKGFSLIDTKRDPNLAYAAVHNQLWFLVECGEFRQAKKLLFLNRRLCDAAGGQVNQLKLRWLEARIDAGLQEPGRAESTLRQVSEGLREVGRSYHASLAALDLAAVLLSRGRAAEAQEVVLEAARVFAALGIEREAMGAVLLLRKSFEMRAASAALVEEVAAFLRRIENDPSARFDPR